METLQDKISAYIAGNLAGEELRLFEKQLQIDAELAAEVTLYRQLRIAIQHSDLIDMNKTLSDIRQKMPTKVEPDFAIAAEFAHKSINWRRWGIGLFLLSLLCVVLWQYQLNQKRELFKTISTTTLKEATPFENVISLGEADNSALAQAMRFYDAGKYSEAIPFLEQHNNSRDKDSFSALYLGICYLMTDKANEAIKLLLPLSTDTDVELSSTAQWHLALGYLTVGDSSKAKPLLEKLQNNARFGNNAKKILDRL